MNNTTVLQPQQSVQVVAAVTITNGTNQNGEVEISESTLAYAKSIPADSSVPVSLTPGGATITNIGPVSLTVSW
jgi:hypothetical protein